MSEKLLNKIYVFVKILGIMTIAASIAYYFMFFLPEKESHRRMIEKEKEIKQQKSEAREADGKYEFFKDPETGRYEKRLK